MQTIYLVTVVNKAVDINKPSVLAFTGLTHHRAFTGTDKDLLIRQALEEIEIAAGKITFYDPPSGWQSGFLRQYLPFEGESLAQTLIRDGYPPKDAEWASQHCRFWSENGLSKP